MAHHHHAPNQPREERKESGDSRIDPTDVTPRKLNTLSHEGKKEREGALRQEKRKSVLDYQIAGFSWPFVFVMSLIAIAVVGMILRLAGAI